MPPEYWILLEREGELLDKLHRWDMAVLNVHDQPRRLAQAKEQRAKVVWALDVVADCIQMYLDDASLGKMATIAISGNIAWVRG